MENKSIEVVICPQDEDVRELNVPFLRKRMQNLKRTLAMVLVVSLLVGTCAGLIRGIITGIGTVSAMVSFAYQGIERGEDPNGAVFDINKIKAPIIVEAALAETGTKDITMEDLRNAMSFESVVPIDIQDRIATLQTIAEKTPSSLEKILEITYHPTQFMLTLDILALGISGSDGKILLTSVIDEYRKWFFTTYGGASSLGESISTVDLATYDYAEAVDIVETQARIISNYLSSLQQKGPSFRSSATGFTFSDLRSQLSILTTVDTARLSSTILSTGLTKDKNSLMAYYSYQIQTANTELVSIQQQQVSTQEAITSYEKDSILLVGSESGTQTTMTQPSQEYDRLFQQQTALSIRSAEQQQRLTLLQQRLDSISRLDTAMLPAEQVAEAKAKVEEALPQLSKKMSDLIRVVNSTADEYYATVEFKTAFQIAIPAHTFSSGIMGLLKSTVIFAVIFVVLGVMVAGAMVVMPPLMTGQLFRTPERNKKGRKEHSDEKE